TKAKCCARLRKLGSCLVRGVARRIRGVGIGSGIAGVGISPHYWCRIQVIKIELLRSRDSLQTCPERPLQRQSLLWHRHPIRGADLFHHALDEEIEDLQLTVEGHDELLIRLNPHDNLWKDVMPEDDIDPTALGNVELTLELRPKALTDFPGNPIFDLSVRQWGLDFQ